MMKQRWRSIALIVIVALGAGYLIGQAGYPPEARAQASSSAGSVAVVMGSNAVDNRVPLAVVDPVERTIMVYEWDFRDRAMYFRAARDYTYDRLLKVYGNASKRSPSPSAVQRRLKNR